MKIKIVFVFLFVCISAFSQKGKVVKVKDGDTVVVLINEIDECTVRIADIDCPERGQPFSKKAKWFTSNEVFGKNVEIQTNGEDKYGRTVGYIIYDDGKNLSHELLKSGLAWHYDYFSKSEKLAQMEKKARINKIGLWSDPKPVNPYQWRKSKKSIAKKIKNYIQ